MSLGLVFAVASAGCAVEEASDALQGGRPEDAIDYIRRSVEEFPIVALAEGGHSALEAHEFLRRVLSDRTIVSTVDVIIVEFATALHQAALDAYISGEDVPFEELSKVWRDTSVSPVDPWNSPLYQELLKVIREANSALSPAQQVRILAGDPPIDWTTIDTREDFRRASRPRDTYVADVAIEQAFDLGKKVLIVFGGAHLPRVPVGAEDDPRNSLTYRILSRHPNGVKAVGFLNPENLGVVDRMDELVAESVYDTQEHWLGELGAEGFFPHVFSRVTDPETGEVSWQELPLYHEYRVRDLFDGLVYIGPPSEWTVVPAVFEEERDEAYLAELDRRSRLRFGRPFDSGG
jgi:hypothetical protein